MNVASIAVIAVPPVVAYGVIALLTRTRWASVLSDHPNERSLHFTPTPRVGGLGVLAGFLPFAFGIASGPLLVLAAAALALAVVSLADDVRSLPVVVRLAAHVAAAAAAAIAWERFGILQVVVVVLAMVWMTNLFNFMDGSDGLAGGMAVIGFGALAVAALDAGSRELALFSAAIATASAGFLLHNFPPARVFLGDTGSIPLGFLAAGLGVAGALQGVWPPWFPVLVFSPFIADATVTLARRIFRRERIWRAHRSHYYQRLVLAGVSSRRLALGAFGLMLAVAASALVARSGSEPVRLGIIAFWAAAYAALFTITDRLAREPR